MKRITIHNGGLLLCLALSFLFSISINAQVSGTVWQDLPVNGTTLNTYGVQEVNELGVEGVTVTVYPGGMSATTASDGTYTIAGAAGAVRVEFSWPTLTWAQSSPDAAAQNTSVQFVTAPMAGVDFGLHNPENFVGSLAAGSEPLIFTAEHKFGPAIGVDNDNATSESTVALPYGEVGDGATEYLKVSYGETGSLYGIAHRKSDNSLFMSSFMKAYTGFGPDATGLNTTTGAIYQIKPDRSILVQPSPTILVDLGATTGVDPHPQPGDACLGTGLDTGNDYINCWMYDNSGDEAGKLGLGDLELSPDGTKLFTVNLNTQSLVEVELSTPDVNASPTAAGVTQYDISAYWTDCASAVGTDWRPFALGSHKGKMYLGVTCTAEQSFSDAVTAGTVTDHATAIADPSHSLLECVVYEFDPNTPAVLTEVTRFDLDYSRTGIIEKFENTKTAAWHPWTYDDRWQLSAYAGGYLLYATPLVSDIEFVYDATDGLFDMVVGIRDRSADQYGWRTGNPHNQGDTRTFFAAGAGEELRLCNNGAGGFTLEDAGTCPDGSAGGAGTATTHGPGAGEYYSDDFFAHSEIFFGSSFQIPGANILGVSAQDLTATASSGGIGGWNHTTGLMEFGARIYQAPTGVGPVPLFGKANGMGDIEYISGAGPIEVGNLVWEDVDSDGVQDADEPGISGVEVKLFKAGVEIGMATTDANGNYIFSNDANGTTTASHIYSITELEPGMDYTVRIEDVSGGGKQAALGMNTLTVANIGEGSNSDLNDSDGIVSGVVDADATILAVNIPFLGANNHRFDFGFSGCPPARCGATTAVKN